MKQYILKHLNLLFCTLVLLLVVLFAENWVTEAKYDDSLRFCIHNGYNQQEIAIYDAKDGNYYVFLPSYADLEQVQIILPAGQEFSLDHIQLSNKMTCGMFELETPYTYFVNGQESATLWFYRSGNVAAMFVDTVSGSMTEIHNDKNYEEYASMALYTANGKVNYYDKSSRIKGRGNATWDCDKRPYILTLSEDGDLLGMGGAHKWVLLANAYDETNLNNKLVYDLASQVGTVWSPECQFVDLYLNGEYNGLYLLTEKHEIHPNRLDIGTASGEFLCTVELLHRRGLCEQAFESSMGRTIEICAPKALPAADFDYVTYLVYLLENEIRSGEDLRKSEILDLDSWVRRYLIDEISGNIDADLTSSYFYYSDGKMYAGPIWDYDMAFGNNLRNQVPCGFVAKNAYKASNLPSPYYGALYENASFYQRMVELYRMEFVPIVQQMMRHGIDEQIQMVSSASKMNSIRWRAMFDEWYRDNMDADIVKSASELKSYFSERIQFLNNAWLKDIEYCTVQIEPVFGGPYLNISVEEGTCLETSYVDMENTTWVDALTDKPMDFSIPISQDLIVKAQKTETTAVPEAPAQEENTVSADHTVTKEYMVYLGILVFFAIFIIILFGDISRCRKEGSEISGETHREKSL